MHRPITKLYNLAGYAGNLAWFAFILVILWVFTPDVSGVYGIIDEDIALLIGALVGMLSLFFLRLGAYKRHQEILLQHASAKGYKALDSHTGWKTHFRGMSVSELKGSDNDRLEEVWQGSDWVYGEYSHDIIRRTRYGDYKAGTVYYSVISAELPRELPHVFFDSLHARGRQFRFHFASSQRHRLEGDFDKHFATYFPEQYTIDSMSFISPDVMWAMRAASDYDIEITGNHVILYGAVHDPRIQIDDMSAKLAAIKKQLLDNILTYRDERMPYAQGRQRVTPLGANLKRSKFWTYVSIAFVIGYILLQIIDAYLGNR